MSFAAIFFFDAPFPLIILGAALIGFALRNNNAPPLSTHDAPVPLSRTGVTIILWLGIWLFPLTVIALALGPDHVLTQTGLFFSKLAVVTFGGAYAVLAYMAQQAVETYGWLSAGEMLDGLGLAETTPGPLILVTEFVGTLAAFRSGSSPAWAMALAGAAVTLWATFTPCFLWIFAGAPYVERIGSNARLSGALSGVTAAVVGVILNLSLWFALHVLFAKVTPVNHGPLRLWTPDFTTFDWLSGALAVLAVILLLWRHWGVIAVLAICAGLGLALKMAL
jgi:chromate transporter